MRKPSRETIRKRAATRRRNAAKRKRLAARRLQRDLNGSEGPQVAARTRLHVDGASSRENTRKRIRFIADQWQLPASDVAKAMTLHTDKVIAFVKKHSINCDWLLCGDLKGFLLMKPYRGATMRTSTALRAKLATRLQADQVERILAKYDLLPPDQQEIAAREIDQLLAQESAEEPEDCA